MNNFDGIIFDVDGTLTSTNSLIFASFKNLGKIFLNRTLTDEEIIASFGPPEDVIIKKWCGSDFERGKQIYYDFYSENHHMADLYPGMREALELIKAKNVYLAIFTGKGLRSTAISMEKLNALDYFDFIVAGDEVVNHKPSAEGILKILDALKLNKERTLMVGDSPVDILAAREAGVKMASVVWDSYAKEEVLKMKSDFVFYTVNELTRFLKDNL